MVTNEVIKCEIPSQNMQYYFKQFSCFQPQNRKQCAHNEVIKLLQKSKQMLLTPLKQKYSVHTCNLKITLLLEPRVHSHDIATGGRDKPNFKYRKQTFCTHTVGAAESQKFATTCLFVQGVIFCDTIFATKEDEQEPPKKGERENGWLIK